MVTEKYLLRSETEWQGRREAMRILDEIVGHLKSGDIRGHRRLHRAQFRRPHPDHHSLGRQSLHRHADSPRARAKWATTSGASGCSAACRAAAWVFCSLRTRKAAAQERLQAIMSDTKRRDGTRRALRHGAGGLRFRHQRTRHRGRASARRRGADAAGILHADGAAAAPHGIPPALARAPRRLERFTAACRDRAGISRAWCSTSSST